MPPTSMVTGACENQTRTHEGTASTVSDCIFRLRLDNQNRIFIYEYSLPREMVMLPIGNVNHLIESLFSSVDTNFGNAVSCSVKSDERQ